MAQFLLRPGSLHYASDREGVMYQRQPDLQEKWRRAAENREYVRRLLAEKQPAFAAAIRAAERHLEWELSARRSSGHHHSGAFGQRRQRLLELRGQGLGEEQSLFSCRVGRHCGLTVTGGTGERK
jgi:hypothetical protein